MLMLIDTYDPRYGSAPDPDEERRRRWEPISLRIVLPLVAAFLCLGLSVSTAPVVGYGLDVVAIVLCLFAARVAWPRREPPDRER